MAKSKNEESKESRMKCGIIMPIAETEGYNRDHWKDVLSILVDAVKETDFEPRLVSDDVAIGLIHDRIVTNIYNDEIVICDVSSKNPNVMFELGLRLAFDKPTIIIKDEKTGYSFDTGVIEHIQYPSSLRFGDILEFKNELVKRINATYNKSKEDPNYSPFLKSFGKTIVPASIQTTEIPEGKFILEQLSDLRHDIKMMWTMSRNSEMNNRNGDLHYNSNIKHTIKNIINSRLNDSKNLSESELMNSILKDKRLINFDITPNDLISLMNEVQIDKRNN
jgi:hypothetical protein